MATSHSVAFAPEQTVEFKNQIKNTFQHYLCVKDALVQSDVQQAQKKSLTLLEVITSIGAAHPVDLKIRGKSIHNL